MPRKVTPDDHLMSMFEFKRDVKDGALMDYDGFGYYVTANKEVTIIKVIPSDIEKGNLLNFPYIIWINK